jgi:hypothetical protein
MGSYVLSVSGHEIEAEQQELEDIDVAGGALGLEQIARWFEDHARGAWRL